MSSTIKVKYGQIVVTYPEALAEKVINHSLLEKKTFRDQPRSRPKLGIDDFINEFLIDYDF